MRCLLIDVPECPDQVIRREGYLATQILNGNWCIVASIQQKAGETNLLMRVQAHRGFLPAESGHCGYYSIFPRDAQRVEEDGVEQVLPERESQLFPIRRHHEQCSALAGEHPGLTGVDSERASVVRRGGSGKVISDKPE